VAVIAPHQFDPGHSSGLGSSVSTQRLTQNW
jgi:hypothetical protein